MAPRVPHRRECQGGRPTGLRKPRAAPDHRQAAQAHVPEVLEMWLAIMRSDAPPGTRAHVGELIYLRAHGKPTPEVAAPSGPAGIVILPAEEEP